MRKLTLAAVLVTALICAPLAFAASSPTVAPAAVTAIGDTVATLHGTVNPNGLATTYQFEYGVTDTLGTYSPAAATSAGAGTATVKESTKLAGLSPDTTYYYELIASNSAGTASTPIETLKTTGNPAPTSTTDPAAGVARYAATLEATINPDNQTTAYFFQYGLTTSYGYQTAEQTMPAGTTPVNVSTLLVGIAPGTVFHYRVIATHSATSTTYGADQSFQTIPWPRPHTSLSFKITSPKAKKAPFSFTVSGTISHLVSTPTLLACHGTVTIRYYDGKREVASHQSAVDATCAYGATTRISHLARGTRLTVRQSYAGDTYQAPSSTTQNTVTAG